MADYRMKFADFMRKGLQIFAKPLDSCGRAAKPVTLANLQTCFLQTGL
ncbi:hypothetical protein [Roseovarius halotolerans]|nr:hypothetical protein [Roseovarius halotolerans]